MKCPAIKLLDNHVPWLGLEIHACWRHGSALAELLRVGNIDAGSVAGKFWFGTRKFKTARLSHHAAASIATHQPFTFKRLVARLNSNLIFCLMEAGNGKPAPDHYTRR